MHSQTGSSSLRKVENILETFKVISSVAYLHIEQFVVNYVEEVIDIQIEQLLTLDRYAQKMLEDIAARFIGQSSETAISSLSGD